MRFFHFALLALLLAASCAEARKVNILGQGNSSCEEWTKAQNKNPESAEARSMFNWVMGLVSGYNIYGPGGGNITMDMSNRDVASWIGKYCKDHSQKTLEKAARVFIEEQRNP